MSSSNKKQTPTAKAAAAPGSNDDKKNDDNDNNNKDEEDLQLAKDMQMAYDLQAKEERKAEQQRRRRRKEEGHHNTLEDGFSPSKLNADHMLFVSCVVEGSHQVHLLVDTGASASAMSTNMVARLGLQSKLNQDIVGNAKGVGSSNIVGVVENVECIIGHVEFRLFFMVLEGQMPYAILGLDQMRRFKCLVDLDESLLVFGGKGGVTEPFLPQQEAMVVAQQMMNMQENPPAATAASTTTQGGGGGTANHNRTNNNKSGGLLKSIFKR